MYKYIRRIIPQILLVIYAIISVGSLEETFISIAYIIGAIALVSLLFYLVKAGLEYRRDKKKAKVSLADAEKKFGTYTSMVETEMGEYILYDEPNNRIFLKDTIIDSRKISRIVSTRKGEKSSYSYESYEQNPSDSLKRRDDNGMARSQGWVSVKDVDTTGYYTLEVFDDEDILRARFLTEEYPYHRKTKVFLQEIIEKNSKTDSAVRVDKGKYGRLLPLVAGNVIAGGNVDDYLELLSGGFVIPENGGSIYELGMDAIDVINGGWNAAFSKARVYTDGKKIRKFTGLSKPYPAVAFPHLKEDAKRLSDYIASKYGQADISGPDLQYSSVTEDKNRITVYWWNRPDFSMKVDVVFDNGRFKYEFSSETIETI